MSVTVKIKKNQADKKDYLKATEDVGSAMLLLMEVEDRLKHVDDPIVKVVHAQADLLQDLMGRLKQTYWELWELSDESK